LKRFQASNSARSSGVNSRGRVEIVTSTRAPSGSGESGTTTPLRTMPPITSFDMTRSPFGVGDNGIVPILPQPPSPHRAEPPSLSPLSPPSPPPRSPQYAPASRPSNVSASPHDHFTVTFPTSPSSPSPNNSRGSFADR